MLSWKRPYLAVAIFFIWAAITAFSSRLWQGQHHPEPLDTAVSSAIQPSLLIAIGFLLAMMAIIRWGDIGLRLPRPLSTIRFVWFPALYVGGFAALAVFAGLPDTEQTLIIAANTFLVGISEELAARGILYRGLRSGMALVPAAITSSALFGVVHVLNGFSTGDFPAAMLQAFTAFMTGIAFMALRIRTNSLLPGIAIHGAWDFCLVVLATGAAGSAEGGNQAASGLSPWLPVALILPNCLYGIFLIARMERDRLPAA